jgi:hypothetical protein
VSRKITEDDGVGEAELEGSEDLGRVPRRCAGASELDEVFGRVAGAAVNAELSAVDDEPPWQWVAAADVGELMAVYRSARRVAGDLRRALEEAGVVDRGQPEVCVRIDAAGQPAIVLGAMSMPAAERLRRLLTTRGRAA